MSQNYSAEMFSATVDPRPAEPRPVSRFNAIEAIKYGFSTMYSRGQVGPWLLLSLYYTVVLLVLVVLVGAVASILVVTGSAAAVFGLLLAMVTVAATLYASACLLRSVVYGFDTGAPIVQFLVAPSKVLLGRYSAAMILVTGLTFVAAIPGMVMIIAGVGSSMIDGSGANGGLALMGVLVLILGVLVVSVALGFVQHGVIDSGMGVGQSLIHSWVVVRANVSQVVIFVVIAAVLSAVVSMIFAPLAVLVEVPLLIASVHTWRSANNDPMLDDGYGGRGYGAGDPSYRLRP